MDDVVKIAEGLTDAQRYWVSNPENRANFWCNDARTAKALQRKQIIATLNWRNEAEWTPLGLAVRAHLEGAEHG